MDQVQCGGFQTGKAHVVGIFTGFTAGKRVLCFITQFCGLVESRAAGIGHSQYPRHLIKALPCRIVKRSAQNPHVRIVLDLHEHGMSAGHHQTQERGLQLRVGNIIGGNMATDVVHRNQGLAHGQRCRLGKIHANQHRADKPRCIGNSYRIDILPCQIGIFQRLLRQSVNCLNMLSGGNLRHHAAVDPVQVHLRGDAVRQHLPPIPDDGYSGFITGGFHSQNIHISHSFPRMSAFSLGFL